MTPGIEYALGAMLFFGLGDLVYKRGAAAGAQPHHFLMVQSWVFAPSVVLYAAWTGSLHFVAGSLWGALTGLFVLVGFYNIADSHGSHEPGAQIAPVLPRTMRALQIENPMIRLSWVTLRRGAKALLEGRCEAYGDTRLVEPAHY
jgi:hypothetical protein